MSPSYVTHTSHVTLTTEGLSVNKHPTEILARDTGQHTRLGPRRARLLRPYISPHNKVTMFTSCHSEREPLPSVQLLISRRNLEAGRSSIGVRALENARA